MSSPQRPRFGRNAVRKVPVEASAFSPFDPTESTMGQLTEETVMRKGRMGDAFIKANRLNKAQVDAIVKLQADRGILFGEAAVQLGYLTSDEVEEVLDKQFNFNTPSGRRSSLIATSLAIVHSPYSEEAEAIRRLRSQVMIRLSENHNFALAVLSPLKREGKSHVAASLAISFAQLNIKTMLVDANLRTPSQHKIFGIANQTGLSTMLAKRSAKTLELTHSVMPSLWVLTAGPTPPNPIEILSPPNLANLLDRFSSDIAVFIIDTPATTAWADGETIVRQAGYALLVGRENFTRLSDMKILNREISQVGVEVLGTVYNRPPPSAKGYARTVWTQITAPLRALFTRRPRPIKGKD